MATFAVGYRTTLQTGAADQAAFAVPLTSTLREGSELVAPQHLAPAASWSQRVEGAFALSVLRRGLSVRRTGTAADTLEVLGLDPQTLDHLHVWRDDFGARPCPDAIVIAPPHEGERRCRVPRGTSPS